MNGSQIELRYALAKIGKKITPSLRLILIVSLHILIIIGNGYIAYHGISMVEDDARIINRSGMIRGGIQKISKLETNGIDASQDIQKIDTYFYEFLHTDKSAIQARNMDAFLEQLQNLHSEWILLKKYIDDNKKTSTAPYKERIVLQSERCWEMANQTVGMAQALSEAKMSTFQLMFVVFFADFVLIIAIIWLINSLVRKNLEIHSRIDPLTGIFNRNVYNEEVYLEIERGKRYGYKFSLLLLDIDHFKQINDRYGHDVGDEILKKVTALIASSIRKSDLFCRIGGEEFAIIATEAEIDNAQMLAEKIRKNVEESDFGIKRTVTISIGIAEWRTQDSKESIFKRADEALYASKEKGRNTVSIG